MAILRTLKMKKKNKSWILGIVIVGILVIISLLSTQALQAISGDNRLTLVASDEGDTFNCVCEAPPPGSSPAPPGKGTCIVGGKGGIETAIGCIVVEGPSDFVESIFGLLLGIAGGVAFVLMIVGAFQVLTSTGNPEKIQAGRELITAAVTGLLLIVFAIFALRLVGAEVLKIPGFS